MVSCPSCGAQNPDNAKFCCQCAALIKSNKRVFIPMCDADGGAVSSASQNAADTENKFVPSETAKQAEEIPNSYAPNDNLGGVNLYSEADGEPDDYSEFRMRSSSEVFNTDESDVFSKNSVDKVVDKKRKRESAKLVKRSEKKHKKSSFEDEDFEWQNNDFWS